MKSLKIIVIILAIIIGVGSSMWIFKSKRNNNVKVKSIIKDTVLELEKILNEYKIYKWDGFNKSDKNVLDGYSFSLNYWNQNKEDIHASGYMMYPNNYKEFRSDIINFYNVLFEEEIKTLKSPIW